MKKIYILIISSISILVSCKKDGFPTRGVASVNIVNASIDDQPMLVYFTFTDSNYYLQNNSLYPGYNWVFSLTPGVSPLTLISVADTTKPLYQTSLSTKAGGIYTLYISGIGRQVDTLLTQDDLPILKDNVAGVRVINLSPGSQQMTVNLEGNAPDQTEFTGLGYKQISNFKTYPANDNGSYNFEVRDKNTGDLLTTFSWSFLVQKNYTLVIGGSEDPNQTTPVYVFAVKNF